MSEESKKPETPFSLGGQLLLAGPTLNDGAFKRSVILLAHHSLHDGAFGMIFNQPSEITVDEIVSDLAGTNIAKLPVHIGGPVNTKELTFSSLSIGKDGKLVFLPRISAEDAGSIALRDGFSVHATLGYSAWSPNQLENELAQNTWTTTPATPDLIKKSHQQKLWNELMREISPYHELISIAPSNPLLN